MYELKKEAGCDTNGITFTRKSVGKVKGGVKRSTVLLFMLEINDACLEKSTGKIKVCLHSLVVTMNLN